MENVGTSRFGRNIKRKFFFGEEKVTTASAPKAPRNINGPVKNKILAPEFDRSRSGRKIKRKKFFGEEGEISASSSTAFAANGTTPIQEGMLLEPVDPKVNVAVNSKKRRKIVNPVQDNGTYESNAAIAEKVSPRSVVQAVDPVEEAKQHREEDKLNEKETCGKDETIPMEEDYPPGPSVVGPKINVPDVPAYSTKKRKILILDQDSDANESNAAVVEKASHRNVMQAIDPVEEAEQHWKEEDNLNEKTPGKDGTIPMEEDYMPEPSVIGTAAAPMNLERHGRSYTHISGHNNEVNSAMATIVENLQLQESDRRGVVLPVDRVQEAAAHQEEEDNLNEKQTLGEDGNSSVEEGYRPEPAVVGPHQSSNINTRFLQISNMNIISIALGVLASKKLKNKKKVKKRPAYRVNPYLLDRNIKGRFASDFQDLMKTEKMFRENFHMSVDEFEDLFSILKPYLLPKRNTRPNDAIDPKQKLAIVLEFLASGDLQRHISSCYRISKQHFGTIIDLVCDAICDGLKSTIPNMNKESFLDIANDYNALWNLPNCVGSIDGKHVALKAPPGSGTMFYSYKGYFTLVMLGICDAQYRFTYLDVGSYGSEGDANIFRHSKFGQQVMDDELEFPEDTSVDGIRLPYFFVGDDAFPLCKRILKPYTGKRMPDDELVFNYRLSRARRCIENAFGILTSKWLCLKKILLCGPDRAQKIITACCFLHNYLLSTGKGTYCSPSFADRIDQNGNIIEGEWRKNISGLFSNDLPPNLGRSSDFGKFIRDNLKNYVNSPIGALPWQKRAAFIE